MSWHVCCESEDVMKTNPNRSLSDNGPFKNQPGKLGWIFLWLIGVPVPLLLVFFLLRGCT